MGAMSSPPSASRPLEVWPCQSICVWTRTAELRHEAGHGDLPVFACTGCGSEWVRTEPWTPIDAAGIIPYEVNAERSRTRSA